VLISCGAALYNLRLAIRVTGHDLVVWLLPDDSDPSLLASVEIVTGRTKRAALAEQELYDAILRRHTNRWPYDNRLPMPAAILAAMQVAAAKEQGLVRVLNRRQVKTWLCQAQHATREESGQDGQPGPGRRADNGDSGMPAAAFGPPGVFSEDRGRWPWVGWREDYPPTRPAAGPGVAGTGNAGDPGGQDDQGQAGTVRVERRPQLLVLSTDYDRPVDWLRAGQALQRAVLTATRYGLGAPYADCSVGCLVGGRQPAEPL
jgi:hypothetical protein